MNHTYNITTINYKLFNNRDLHLVPNAEDCRDKLLNLLVKYKMVNNYGINYLHNHFKINPGEILVQEYSKDLKSNTTTVNKLSEVDTSNYFGSQFYIYKEGNNLYYSPILLTKQSDKMVKIPFMEKLDLNFLSEFYDILELYDCVNKFGVFLRNDFYTLNSNQILTETHDIDKRLLFVNIRDKTKNTLFGFDQTQWIMNKVGTQHTMACVSDCVKVSGVHVPFCE